MTKLIGSDPPTAGIDSGAQIPSQIARLTGQPAFLCVANRQLGAGPRLDLHRGAGDEIADLLSGEPRGLRPHHGPYAQTSRRCDRLEH